MADPVRKLIVCSDGTWNEPYQEGTPTNVVKMVRAIKPIDDQGVAQLLYYHVGVGTGNVLDRWLGGALGEGLCKNVEATYDFLAANFVDGDKIYLFGFSRGAFTVRSLAGLVGMVGLLEKGDMDLFPYLYDIYRSREHRDKLATGLREDVQAALRALFSEQKLGKNFDRLTEAILGARPTEIFFIGVWDTVGSLGIPGGHFTGQSKYSFHNTDLSDRIRFAYHALAIDERRKNFEPTLWQRPIRQQTGGLVQTLEQVWFAGAHSGVGGGYEDHNLSDIAFLWMVSKAAAASREADAHRLLAFDEVYLKQIGRSMGQLEDSQKGVWEWLGTYERPIAAAPPAGYERCEFIHWSAGVRFRGADQTQFSPFPYRPANLKTAFGAKAPVMQQSAFEQSYPWPI